MADADAPQPRSHLPVIHAGLYRTGTASMAQAYRMLGLRAHHGHDMIDNAGEWVLWEEAAEATWPDVPDARPRPRWSRADWDRITGPYDVITDIGCLFAEELIRLYPEARVVIVERDVNRWLPSFETGVTQTVFGWFGTFMGRFILPLSGTRIMPAMRKTLLGGFGARDAAELRARAPQVYAEYYGRIRALVPPERRLEYRLGDGWEPLCAFLEKPVPDAPFPRVNEAADHRAKNNAYYARQARRVIQKAKPWVLATVAVYIATVATRRLRK